jgi:hypothetical protein
MADLSLTRKLLCSSCGANPTLRMYYPLTVSYWLVNRRELKKIKRDRTLGQLTGKQRRNLHREWSDSYQFATTHVASIEQKIWFSPSLCS